MDDKFKTNLLYAPIFMGFTILFGLGLVLQQLGVANRKLTCLVGLARFNSDFGCEAEYIFKGSKDGPN